MAGSITGLDDVLHRMETMRLNVQKKHVGKASRKAMSIVKKKAQENAKAIDDPATREAIHKNIAVRAGRSKSNYSVVRVGILGGAATNKNSKKIVQKQRRKKGEAAPELDENTISLAGGDTRHWRHREFGTSKQAAEPFMRPALADNTDAVIDDFANTLRSDIEADVNS